MTHNIESESNNNFTLTKIQEVIDYIEENLIEELTLNDIATHFYWNSSTLNGLFKMATNMTMMEYIRNRRLSLAGQELMTTKIPIIDLALKYGYETPEAFTKAFVRFYGFPPSFVRRTYPRLRQFKPIQIHLKIQGGWEPIQTDERLSALTKVTASEQEKDLSNNYNDSIKTNGGLYMENEKCKYHINLKEMSYKEDWRILMHLTRKLKAAGIKFKVDGKTMIFAHGLEFKLEKICLTFKWDEEQKVRSFFGEEGISEESYPGFKYFDTMFEGMKVRCMCYTEFPGSDTDEVLFQNTDLVEVDGEKIRVQSLEFYYENAKPDAVYYKMVEDFLKVRK